MRHRGQVGAQLLHHLAPVDVFAAIGHAVHREKHFGFDLFEAVQHGLGAHVGRADAPHAADAHRGDEGDHRLRDVRQVTCDTVAWLDAHRLQLQRERRDLLAQLRPGDLTRAGCAERFFVVADDGHAARFVCGQHVAKDLLGVIDGGAFKPLGVDHSGLAIGLFGLPQHRSVRRRRMHVKVVPDALPETVQVRDRPAPQLVIRAKLQAALVAQPILVEPDLGEETRGGIGHGSGHGLDVEEMVIIKNPSYSDATLCQLKRTL